MSVISQPERATQQRVIEGQTTQEITQEMKTPGKTPVKVSGKMSGKILAHLVAHPAATIPELALLMDVTERTIERYLRKLQEDRLLKRVGPAKGGHWEVAQ